VLAAVSRRGDALCVARGAAFAAAAVAPAQPGDGLGRRRCAKAPPKEFEMLRGECELLGAWTLGASCERVQPGAMRACSTRICAVVLLVLLRQDDAVVRLMLRCCWSCQGCCAAMCRRCCDCRSGCAAVRCGVEALRCLTHLVAVKHRARLRIPASGLEHVRRKGLWSSAAV